MNDTNKPDCELTDVDGNVFNLIGKTVKCLNRNGMREQAIEFNSKAFDCESYDAVLNLISEYVNVV